MKVKGGSALPTTKRRDLAQSWAAAPAKRAPEAFYTGFTEPPCVPAGDAERPQGVIKEKERGGERKELAIGQRRRQEANGEIA